MELTTKLQDKVDVLHSSRMLLQKTNFLSLLVDFSIKTGWDSLQSVVSCIVVDGDEISWRFQKYQAKVLKISGPIKTDNSFILLTCWVGPLHTKVRLLKIVRCSRGIRSTLELITINVNSPAWRHLESHWPPISRAYCIIIIQSHHQVATNSCAPPSIKF